MRILLVDIDSKIPNLALMQISAYHKNKGDQVGFHISDPDIVYASAIFTKNKHDVDGLRFEFPDAQINIGGSGINHNWLPLEMQKVKPDYDLYEMNYSLGFTTRGCIRRCSFCIVPEKEGKYRRWMHISEFHDDRFDTVELLDNNWYADKVWFFDNSQWLINHGLKMNVQQGMDFRLLNTEIAERLRDIEWSGNLHFAYDNMSDERFVIDGLKLLKEVGFDTRSEIKVYVLVDFNTTMEQDIYRCNILKELNTNPFVMNYQQIDPSHPKKLNNRHAPHLTRWANREEVFWSTDFKDYDHGSWKKLRQHKDQTVLMSYQRENGE